MKRIPLYYPKFDIYWHECIW